MYFVFSCVLLLLGPGCFSTKSDSLFAVIASPLTPHRVHLRPWLLPNSAQLMSLSTQHYLKELLRGLKIIAWQRKGGLSADLLAGAFRFVYF